MNLKPYTLIVAFAGLFAFGAGASAQTTATPAPAQEEVIVLSPFEVTATSDRGYAATETIAGGRTRTRLKDVSAQVDIMTQEFLSDLGLNTLDEALKYSLSVENESDFYDPTGSSATLTANPSSPGGNNRSRGLVRASTSIGFFETSVAIDSFNTERIAFVSGPNAVLFGNGQAGGSIDTQFKRANTARNRYSVSLQVDSEDGYRGTVDIGQVLVKDRLAFRLATMQQDLSYGRQPSYDRAERTFGTISYEPMKKVKVRAYYDYGNLSKQPVRSTLVQDKVTPYLDWLDARSPGAKAQFLATYNPSVLIGFDNSAINSFPAGANNNAANAALLAQGFGPIPGRANTDILNRLDLSAQPILISGGVETSPIPIMQWHNTSWSRNGPGPFVTNDTADWSFADNAIYPSTINLIGNGLQNATITRIYGGIIELNPANDLFIEYGYNRESARHSFTETLTGGNSELAIDLNRFLPARWATGTTAPARVANPNYGRYYVQSGVGAGENLNEREDHRLTATYYHDFRKNAGWTRWLGAHQLLGLWTSQMNQRFEQVRNGGSGATVVSENAFTVAVTGTTQAPLPSAAINMTNNARKLQVRHYLGSPTAGIGGAPFVDLGVDPWKWGQVGTDVNGAPVIVSGPDLPWGDTWSISNGHKLTEGIMVSLQSSWWDGRIITNYGRRWDDNTYSPWLPTNLQPRYDAATGTFFKPTSPITGTHPLVNAPYADWRVFEKYGFDNMIDSARIQTENAGSELYGIVVHPLSWFSLFYNDSTSAYAAEFARTNLDGTPTELDDGVGKDYGFAVSLPNGKLSFRVNFYENSRTNSLSGYRDNSGTGQKSLRDTMYHPEKTFLILNPTFDISGIYNYYQQLVLDQTHTITATTNFSGTGTPNSPIREAADIISNRFAEGVEFSLTANPLSGLSISLKVAKNKTVETDVASMWYDYADSRWQDWESIANVPMYNVVGQATTMRTYFQNVILPSMSYLKQVDGLPNPQERSYRVNLTARYQMQQGALKGFYYGGNYSWRSPSKLGFYTRTAEAADVYREFAGVGAGAFQVPDFTAPIEGTKITTLDAFAGYRKKFYNNKLEWVVQLNIRNVLNDQSFIPQRAFGIQNPDGSGRQSFFTNYNIQEPRRFILTNTINF